MSKSFTIQFYHIYSISSHSGRKGTTVTRVWKFPWALFIWSQINADKTVLQHYPKSSIFTSQVQRPLLFEQALSGELPALTAGSFWPKMSEMFLWFVRKADGTVKWFWPRYRWVMMPWPVWWFELVSILEMSIIVIILRRCAEFCVKAFWGKSSKMSTGCHYLLRKTYRSPSCQVFCFFANSKYTNKQTSVIEQAH